jgi:SAM-dependent methyltransferase
MTGAQTPSMLNKWAHYSKRYGMMSAFLRYIGRRVPWTWSAIGSLATVNYLKRWTNKKGTKVLNLCGGGNLRPEWLTADIDPRADVYVDSRKPLPFADCSIDAILLEEAIEHLAFREGLGLLKECRRVLKIDGQLRVSTPDFSWFESLQEISNLDDAGRDVFKFVCREGLRFLGLHEAPNCLMQAATLNQIFLSHGHRLLQARSVHKCKSVKQSRATF